MGPVGHDGVLRMSGIMLRIFQLPQKVTQQSHYLSLRYTVRGGRRFPELLRCLLDLFFEDERFQLHRLANGLSAELQFQIKATLRV